MRKRVTGKSSVRNARRKMSTSYVMEDQVGFLMRVAMQRHTSIFMSLMAYKLTQTQFAALAKLIEVGACSQNRLGRLIYLDHATIKGVIDRLRRRKLVTKFASPKRPASEHDHSDRKWHRAVRDAIILAHRITAETLAALQAPGAARGRPASSENDLSLIVSRSEWRPWALTIFQPLSVRIQSGSAARSGRTHPDGTPYL